MSTTTGGGGLAQLLLAAAGLIETNDLERWRTVATIGRWRTPILVGEAAGRIESS